MSESRDTPDPPVPGNTKGIGVVNVQAWVLEHHGSEMWARVLDDNGLTDADRDVIRSVVAVGWIPIDTYARLFRAVDSLIGTGDGSIVRAISRYQAERDLKTVYRLLLRLKSPAYVITKTGSLWRRYHDTGSFAARRDGPCEATGILEGWAARDEVLCAHNVLAYVHRTLELAGARDVSVHHRQCARRGDAWCEYAASWR